MTTMMVPVKAGAKSGWRWGARALLEVFLIAALWSVYDAGRILARGEDTAARAHAHLIRNLEHALSFPRETLVQHVLTAVPDLPRLANMWYVGMHFPVTVAFLVFGFVFRPRIEYAWARNLLATITGLALIGHLTFPLAPPRMFPQWGFVDTMARYGPDAYGDSTAHVANQFAAMPSLHVGWALLIAYVLFRTGPRRLAVIAAAYAATTTFVVISTANHWWLDALAAAVVLGLAVLIFPGPGRTRLPLGPFTTRITGGQPDDDRDRLLELVPAGHR